MGLRFCPNSMVSKSLQEIETEIAKLVKRINITQNGNKLQIHFQFDGFGEIRSKCFKLEVNYHDLNFLNFDYHYNCTEECKDETQDDTKDETKDEIKEETKTNENNSDNLSFIDKLMELWQNNELFTIQNSFNLYEQTFEFEIMVANNPIILRQERLEIQNCDCKDYCNDYKNCKDSKESEECFESTLTHRPKQNISLNFLLEFGRILFNFMEYSINKRNALYHSLGNKNAKDNFFHTSTLHPIFLLSDNSNAVRKLATTTNNVMEEVDTGMSLNNVSSMIDAASVISRCLESIEAADDCNDYKFTTNDGFQAVFLRIDSDWKVFKVKRDMESKDDLSVLCSAEMIDDSIEFDGYLMHYSPVFDDEINSLKDINNIYVKLTTISCFQELCSVFRMSGPTECEVNLTLLFDQKPLNINENSLYFACLEDLYHLLSLNVTYNENERICVDNSVINDTVFVRERFAVTRAFGDVSGNVIGSVNEWRYVLQSERYDCVFYEMNCIEINAKLLGLEPIKARNMFEYYFLNNERAVKSKEHQTKYQKLLKNEFTVSDFARNSQNCDQCVATLQTSEKESDMSLLGGLLCVPTRDVYPNPCHMFILAVCEAMERCRLQMSSMKEITDNKERFKQELFENGGSMFLITKTKDNNAKDIECLVTKMAQMRMIDNIKKYERKEIDWNDLDSIFSDMLENAVCQISNDDEKDEKCGNCEQRRLADRIFMINFDETYDIDSDKPKYSIYISYECDIRRIEDSYCCDSTIESFNNDKKNNITTFKVAQSCSNGELLQCYLDSMRMAPSMCDKQNLFESSVIVVFNPLESYSYSCMKQAPKNMVPQRPQRQRKKKQTKQMKQKKIQPYYDLCRPLLCPADLYFMFYQSNLINIDDLRDIRTPAMMTSADCKDNEEHIQCDEALPYTITRAIYDVLRPSQVDMDAAKAEYVEEQILNNNKNRNSINNDSISDVNKINNMLASFDVNVKIVIIPPSVRFDETSQFFKKWTLEIAPVFSDMRNWPILFLYRGRLYSYLPYQEYTNIDTREVYMTVKRLQTDPIVLIDRLIKETNQFKSKYEKSGNIDNTQHCAANGVCSDDATSATESKDSADSPESEDSMDGIGGTGDISGIGGIGDIGGMGSDDCYWDIESSEDEMDIELENEMKLQWWEKRKKWHPIDTYIELSSDKKFNVVKIVNKKPLQCIRRSVPLRTVTGEKRTRDDLENDIANELFFATADAKVASSDEYEIREDLECSICQSMLNVPSSIGNNECKHLFCRHCISKWSDICKQQNGAPRCPLCRRNIVKIMLDEDMNKVVKQKMPVILCKQRAVHEVACTERVRLVALHHYTQQLSMARNA